MHLKSLLIILSAFIVISGGVISAQDDIQYFDAPDKVIGIMVHGYPSSAYDEPGEFIRVSTGHKGLPLNLCSDRFRIPKEQQSHIFAYRLSHSRFQGGDEYTEEIGNFNRGSYRLTYENPQCHISLAKCEWLYRKAFYEEPFDLVPAGDADDEREILIYVLLRGNLRFVDLFISPGYIREKLGAIDFSYPYVPDKDGNGRLGEFEEPEDSGIFKNEYDYLVYKNITFTVEKGVDPLPLLAEHLYNTAKEYENMIPDKIWLLTHSMGGMFVLRYLTADPEETRKRIYPNHAEETDTIRLYEYYKDYTYEKFLADIVDKNGFRYLYIQDILNHMIGKDDDGDDYWPQVVDDETALQELYKILKRERSNNVPKVILQDGPLAGSHVAGYAHKNFDTLRKILENETEWAKWKNTMIAACVANIILSSLEIALGVHYTLAVNPFLFELGKSLIIHGTINILMDTALAIILVATSLKDYPIKDLAGNTYLDSNGKPIIDKAISNPLLTDRPINILPSALLEFHIKNKLEDFDIDDVKIMTELRPGSDFIKSYKDKSPPTYYTEDGSIENIEIHNIVVAGVESISTSGGIKLEYIPFFIGIGYIQSYMLWNIINYLITYTDPATCLLTLGAFEMLTGYRAGSIMPYPEDLYKDLPAGTVDFTLRQLVKDKILKQLGTQAISLVLGIGAACFTYIYSNSVSTENASTEETFIGLMYDILQITHEPGAGLFCKNDATGLTPGREVNPIQGNENAYVYNIDVTTQYQKTSQKLIGNTSPYRQEWGIETYWKNYDFIRPEELEYLDIYDPYTLSHGWSINTIFRPISASVNYDGELLNSMDKGTYLFFNNYLYCDINNTGPHVYDSEYGDVSQVTRKITTLKNDNPAGSSVPLWEYRNTDDLRGRFDRNLYYHFMFGYLGGNTANNVVFSLLTRYGNQGELTRSVESRVEGQLTRSVASRVDRGQLTKSVASRVDRGLTPMMYEESSGGGKISGLESIQFTTPVSVMPFDIYNYYNSLDFAFSINGGPFVTPIHISEIQGFDTLDAYGEYMADNVNPQASVVYNDHGQALLVSPHFKEGYNLVVFQFTDPSGNQFEKDVNIIQNTVPLFLKPLYPLMNQYIGSHYVSGAIQALDISDTGTGSIIKREDWFEIATYTILIDGNPVSSFYLDPADFTIYFNLPYLEDGNHVIEVTADYEGNENSVGWRFWVDTTPPEILFPKNMIFSNRNEQNHGVVSAFVKDQVPYSSGSLNKDVDTVLLSSLTMSVTGAGGSTIDEIINESVTRLGAHSRNWNGWSGNSPLSHGIYALEVEAIDRVGNSKIERADIILDNQGPVFDSLSINNTLVNTNTDLLEISYSLSLDSWETKAFVDVVVYNVSTHEAFGLTSVALPDTEEEMVLSYFTEGENVFKDGIYDIIVIALDELGNSSEMTKFEGIIVDRTKPKVENAYATPFLLETGDTSLDLYFDLNENDDRPENQSGSLPGTIELVDCYGNILDPAVGSGSFATGSVKQHVFISVPSSLHDGKYFLNIKMTDKNENRRDELVPFVKNAINPKITYPDEGAFIDGTATIKGNVIDPRFNNNLSFYRYELYYTYGIAEIPENPDLLTGWETTGIYTPGYQQKGEWTANCGQFPVEGGDVLGFLDTSYLPGDGNVTVLLVVEEEGGYRIGITRMFFYLPGSMADLTVDLTIDPAFTAGATSCLFNTEGDVVSVPYSVVHDINNPVNVSAFVKQDQTGSIVRRIEYIDLKSNDIKGIPAIESTDKGIFIYQDEADGRFYFILKNNGSQPASLFALISTNFPMTSFVDAQGAAVTTPEILTDNGRKLILSKYLTPGESFTTGFLVDPDDAMTITGTMDQGIPVFYLGKNRFEETSGTIVIYPGTNYPPVKWDGKDEFGRYVENGHFTLGIEAFGKLGGHDSGEVNLDVFTPVTITWSEDDISNRTFHPGLPQPDLSTCSVRMVVSKGAVINAEVRNQVTDEFIRTLTPQPASLDTMGVFILTWEGIDGNNLVVPEGQYKFIVTAAPHDGSSAATVVAGNIVVDTSIDINPLVTAFLEPFEGTQEFNNVPVVQGDTAYHIEIQPKGAYLPDRNVDMTIKAGDGTKAVEAFPDMNYMVGFRTNFTELWARVKMTKAKILLVYKTGTGLIPKFYEEWYDITINTNNEYEGKVISYDDSTNNIYYSTIAQSDQNIQGTVTAPGCIYREVDGETDLYFFYGQNSFKDFGGTIIRGKQYMEEHPRVYGTKLTSKPAIDPYNSDKQTVPLYMKYDQMFWFSNSDTFRGPDYFSVADGFAVMGPDISTSISSPYLKNAPYVHGGEGGSFIRSDFITDPVYDTGMTPLTPDGNGGEYSENVWRKNPQYYFYYVGEKFPDQIGEDSFTRFNFQGTGGGVYHGSGGNLTIANPDYHASGVVKYGPFTSNFTEQTLNENGTNGDVVFTLKQESPNHFSAKVESLARDTILYYYPARVSRDAFIQSHDVGTQETDTIPPARINGTRDNRTNAQLPAYHVNISQVLFPDDPVPTVTYSRLFQYKYNSTGNAWRYEGELDLSNLFNDVMPAPDELDVSILSWKVSDVSPSPLVFPGLVGMSIKTEDLSTDEIILFPEEMPVYPDAGVENSWTLADDTNTGGEILKGSRTSPDISAFNRDGELPQEYISGYYVSGENYTPSAQSMYLYDEEGTLMDNEDVIIHPETLDGKYIIRPVGLDGTAYEALNTSLIHYSGKGLKTNDYFILEKTNKNPKRVVAVEGAGSGSISVAYLDQNGLWKQIPANNVNQDPGVITYWDVTGLNGYYAVRLISEDPNNGMNIAFTNVYIGTLVNTTDTGSTVADDVIITSSGGEASLILPENSVTGDTVISVDTVELEEIKDVAILPQLAPLGKIVNLQPDGFSFDDIPAGSRPQVQFTFHKSELDQVDPLKLNIYQLRKNGELEILPTIKQTFDENGDPIWSSPDDPSGNNYTDDYEFLRAWTLLDHFSYYMIVEGELPKNPVITTKGFITKESSISIHGQGIPGESLKLYVIDNPFFDPALYTPVNFSSPQVVEPDGTFMLSNIPLPFEGDNFIYLGYSQTMSTMFSKLVVTKDTLPPLVATTVANSFISPDNDGIHDSLLVSLTSDEDGTVKIQLINSNNGEPLSEKQLQLVSQVQQSTVIDGRDYAGYQIPDGMYGLKITASDKLGNSTEYIETIVTIDRIAPAAGLTGVTPAISPKNQDSLFDTVTAAVSISEPGIVSAWIGNIWNNKIKCICAETLLEDSSAGIDWDGRDSDSLFVKDGDYFITLWIRDRAGNACETSFMDKLIKVDNTAPGIIFHMDEDAVIVVPSDNLMEYSLAEKGAIEIRISDPHDQILFALSQGGTLGLNSFNWNAPESLEDGNYKIYIEAKDSIGNRSVYIRDLEITHDHTPPILVVPGTIVAEATARLTPVDPGQAAATDQSPPVVISNNAPALFPPGSTVVTWTASDRYGNTATATQVITVVDTTPPVLAIPADITVTATGLYTPVDTGDAAATDIFNITISNDAPPVYPLGTTIVTWTAKDENGNSTSAGQAIKIIDEIGPVILISGITSGGDYTDSATPVISISDNESGVALESITLDGNPYTSGTMVTGRGVHTLVASAEDYAGNTTIVTTVFSIYWATELGVAITGCDYGDPAYVDAVLTSHDEPVSGKIIEILINGTIAGTITTGANGTGRTEIVIPLSGGTYPVTAGFYQDDPDFYRASAGSAGITVVPEKAVLEYTGCYVIPFPWLFTLQAKVMEEPDGSTGNKENARVCFMVYRVEPDESLTFVNSYTVQCNARGTAITRQSLPVGLYSIEISLVDDGYYTAAPVHVNGVVYKPGKGFASGGGWYKVPDSHRHKNNKAHFSFNVKYRHYRPTGNFMLQSRPDRINLVGKRIEWIVIQEGYAQFQGTGTLYGRRGFYTFRVTCIDNGYSDVISITIWQGRNTDTAPVFQILNQPLDSGNIVVKTVK